MAADDSYFHEGSVEVSVLSLRILYNVKGLKGIMEEGVLVLIHWDCSYTQLTTKFFAFALRLNPSANAYYGGRRVGVIGMLHF